MIFLEKLTRLAKVKHSRWLFALWLVLLCPLAALSVSHATGLDDLEQLLGDMEGEETFLLGIMEEETTIATRSKLNADYVPGMITILHGDVLYARGATTVAEALAFVPGIEKSHDRIGNQVALVRGVGGSFASGNMKVLVDGVSINSALSALADPVFLMPIEQVERIEVIRGPGSALYGEYAYAGVINVVTQKNISRSFAGGGSFNKRSIGGTFSAEDPQSGAKFSVSLARWQRGDTNTPAGEDVLYNTQISQAAISNAPGSVNDEVEYKSALFNLGYGDFTLKAQLLDNKRGDYFGTLDALPDPNKGVAYQNHHQNLTLSHLFTPNPYLVIQPVFGWQRYENSFDITMLPAGYIPYPAGFLARGFYRERQLNGSVELHWGGWQGHNLLVTVAVKEIEVREAWRESNIDLSNDPTYPQLPSMQRFTGVNNWVNENNRRTIHSVVIQDEYLYSDQTTYTLGMRYDKYNDVGDNISPRLAGVFRYSDAHILKVQYAHAFRPPSFYELCNSTANAIKPETIRTLELAYIHRLWNRVDRIILFHSKMRNLIVSSENLINLENLRHAEINGIEAETERYLSDWIKLNANLSYSNATDSATSESIAGAAKWLGTFGVLMEHDEMTFSVDLHYVGSRAREADDPRSDLASYHTVNTTMTYTVPNSRLTLRAGIKNLFDQEVRYPASMTTDNTPAFIGDPVRSVVSYMSDYPQPGRNGWVQMSYPF